MAEHIDSKGQKDCVTDDRRQFINKPEKSRPNTNDCRATELAQQLQALWSEFAAEDEDAGDIAARPAEASDQAELHRIDAGIEDNGNCRRRTLFRTNSTARRPLAAITIA